VTFGEARALFPTLERVAYLNTGSAGPLASPVAEAIEAEVKHDLEHPRSGAVWFERALALRDQLRRALADLVGADSGQVALTASTTDGCNIVLSGLDLGPDDEVVTTDSEHFALLGPLHVSRAHVVVTSPNPDAILAAVGPKTRLIAVSQVLWTTGAVLPVRELRERSGVPVLVDGAQSVGAVPVDARGLDFLTISGQKWLCGPEATGALVVADPERLRIARPSYFSQVTHERDGTFVPRGDARRFEPNWLPLGAVAGLRTALSLVPEWGFDQAARAARRCRELLAPLVELRPGDATLVSFNWERDPAGLVAALEQSGVVVREIPGRDLVRVSVGWWTDESDLLRLREALAA
jgi:L-cysteine/cystine lyase